MVEKKNKYPGLVYAVLLVFLSMLVACDFLTRDPTWSPPNQENQNTIEDKVDQNEDQNYQGQDQQHEEPGTGPGQPGQWANIDHGGFGFWYDPMVILEIMPETIPLVEDDSFQGAHPPFVLYDLLLDSGAIAVVEIGWYKDISEAAAEIFPDLEELIDSKTPLGLECIPELPLLSSSRECGHQQFNASIGFVDFENGSGVRFVSVYGIQDTTAIDNQHLVYVYQGITDDRQCYVWATFRLTHDALEEYAEVPGEVFADMTGEIMNEYFSENERLLDTNPDGYMPLLERFDLIIQSIEVSYCTSG